MDKNSLAHTKWNCKYHIVFTPKYRRQAIYGKIKKDIEVILTAIRLSRATIKNIKENLFWAFFYNSCGIPIAGGLLYLFTGHLLNPMIAGLAMGLSSVSVVSNALRLKRFK